MKKNEKKYKHLTYNDRLEIQECLAKGMSFKDIGKRISKDPTTVSKEVKLHTVTHTNSFFCTSFMPSKKAHVMCIVSLFSRFGGPFKTKILMIILPLSRAGIP